MSRLTTHRGIVYPWQCDHNGHMNVMWYVGKFDEATWCLFADMGLTPNYLRGSRRGMVAVEQHLTYKRELFAGDNLIISSRVLGVTNRFVRFEHSMWSNREEPVAAIATLTGVHIDADKRSACPFPAHVRQDLEAAINEGSPNPRRPS